MPSTYSDSLRIELIAAGEQAGTWNITTNRNLGTLIEHGIAGVEGLNISTGSRELLALNGAADEARNAVLILTGTPTAGVTLTVPNADKQYTVQNRTVQPVTFNTDGGSGYTCPPKSTSTVVINAVGAGEVSGLSISDAMAAALRTETFAGALDEMGAAALASPVFTGTPQGPTAARGASTKQLATTEFVQQNGLPSGSIILWSGSVASIPTGWTLCNGANNTPNLQNRFVIGAGSSYAVGNTGGWADAVVVSHNHGGATGTQSHNHTHSGSTSSAGNHRHSVNMNDADNRGGRADRVGSSNHNVNYTGVATTAIQPAGAHTHSFTTGGNSASHTHTIPAQGVSGTGRNMPPYYALCYIMKI